MNISTTKKNIFVFIILSWCLFAFANLSVIDASAPSCTPNCEFEPDFSCINRKILDPTFDCCENKCVGAADSVELPEEYTKVISVFGSTIVIDTSDPIGVISVLVNLAITTVLGFISLYALIRGIYEGGIKRAKSIDAGEIEASNKTVQTLILGFVLAWSFIFIIQFVASIIGLGSLSDLQVLQGDLSEDSGGDQIIIN